MSRSHASLNPVFLNWVVYMNIWTNQSSSKWIRCSSVKYDRGDTWSQVSLVSHLKQLFSIMVKITLHLVSLCPTLTPFKRNCITCRCFPENQHRIDERSADPVWCCFGGVTHSCFFTGDTCCTFIWLVPRRFWILSESLKIPSCSQVQILHYYP